MKKTTILLLVGFVAVIFQGCAKKADVYGSPVSKDPPTALIDILSEPNSYTGKTVTVSGKIASECPSGCWFDVQQGKALVRIDIAPAGLAIPQRVGKDVVVTGTIRVRDNIPTLVGKGVEIK